MAEPARPESVPPNAEYNVASKLWEFSERDEHGLLDGTFTAFRTDGALVTRGSYRAGKLDGTLSYFTDDTPGARPLRACCVPPGARELRARYRGGRFLDETFFDEHGHPLCEDGAPWPERDPAVPESARYDPANGRFIDRSEHADGTTTLRVYEPAGPLDQEVELAGGWARVKRSFARDGTCREQTGLDERGARHGAFYARYAEEDAPYVDSRVREVIGCYEHGEPVGNFELRDVNGELVRRVDYGEVLGARAAAVVAGTEAEHADAETLWRLAAEPGRPPREALALAARAAAKSRDGARFEQFYAERAVPLRPELARAEAERVAAAPEASPSSLLGAWLAGARAPVLLRRLATCFAAHGPAALDYFDLSLLFAPEQALVGLGGALLAIEHGDPARAVAAAEHAERETQGAAEFLQQFVRVTYDAFSFCPARDGVAPPDEELVEVEAAQSLAAVVRTLELYATRLLRVRRELERRALSAPSWLPPDTSALLPRGPLELRRYTVQIEDEGDDGPEISDVVIDETLGLERSTRQLLTTARSDWAALGWLCWSAGLDRVERPARLVSRPNFPAAAHQATVRCWRAHDRLRTRGLVALARDVESFDWEGMPIDAVPPHLLEVVAAEYLEVRGLFFWLLFPQNQSPFQADLRRV
jgi:hypothetical protein